MMNCDNNKSLAQLYPFILRISTTGLSFSCNLAKQVIVTAIESVCLSGRQTIRLKHIDIVSRRLDVL